MKCVNCNSEFQGAVCPNCGTPYQVVTNNLIVPKKKRKLKIWQIILISVGVFFALIGLFFSFIVWLSFTFGTNDTQTETNSQLNVEAKNIYELDIENTLCNITYKTPSEFETKGTSGVILNHKSPDNDNLLVSYIDLGSDVNMFTESDAKVVLDSAVTGTQGDSEDFELYSKEYIKIEGCSGISFSYEKEGVYAQTFSFLYGDGAYQFSYSSVESISVDDEQLILDVMNSINLQY